ncbi:ABC-three component system protein [Massilia sp. Bi118]|uniref:ABC-three component system protein n=1 Tax=Massilia sp. Bi118 TaxID=2822346 RepID=UPI001E30E1E2|nr:ABC-three component system protein [Massilia sp. Bi118]
MSLEYLDDVAVHYADGTLLLEQCKSALAHNPISDWSDDLWKTVANWFDAVETQKVDGAKTSFKLYVTPPKPGKLSTAMHTAADEKAIEALVKQVKDKLKKKANAPKCIAHVQKFINAPNALRLAVVGKATVFAADADPLEPLRELLRPTIPEALLDVICASAIGQAKEAADKCIRRKVPAVVAVAEFQRNFHAFVQQNNMAGYLPTFTAAPSKDAAKALLTNRPVFVRQLQLIQASEEQQLRAVSDLMRMSGDKVKWAEQGLVFNGTFEDWEGTLLRKHDAAQSEVRDTYAEKTQEAQGRIVYSRCAVMEVPLDSRVVPGHFTHGGFNDLADRQELGWHPEHKTLLNKEDKK